MTQTAQIKQYMYDWLCGLNIGPVFEDSKPMDDTTKSRVKRTYVKYLFEGAIEDMGGYFQGDLTIIIGARDAVRFVSAELVLAEAEKTLTAQFIGGEDRNDTENGVSMTGLTKVDEGFDQVGNHEYVYSCTVYVEKGEKGVPVNS